MKLLRFIALVGTLLIAVRAPAQNSSCNPRRSCSPTKVFLIHGIAQTGAAMDAFKTTLILQLGRIRNPATGQNYVAVDSVPQNNPDPTILDHADFVIDDSFSFAPAADTNCRVDGSSCEIDDAASLLASTINQLAGPFDHVILIGYSMGGLIARNMIANAAINNSYSVFNLQNRRITALITLGTPNLGYPWAAIDDATSEGSLLTFLPQLCPVQADLMGSDFNSGQNSTPPTVALSATPNGVQLPRGWLDTMTNYWGRKQWPANWSKLYWEAISGSYCNRTVRAGLSPLYGCPNYNSMSDGVVCDQSARYQPPSVPQAVDYYTHNTYGRPPKSADTFSNYGHTNGSIFLCQASADYWLFQPQLDDPLTRTVGLVVGQSK